MKVNWLLEKDVFEENLEELQAAITELGHRFKVHEYVPFEGDSEYLRRFASDDCVVFYGSLNFGKQIRWQSPWVPGAYCNLDHFLCSYYYPLLGKFLLNERYTFLPYGEILRLKDFLFESLGDSDSLFMRPNSGFKLFHGQVLHRESFEKQFEYLNFYENMPPDEWIVVAQPVNLDTEWRLVVVDHEVVAGSQYRTDFKPDVKAGCPDDVTTFANEIIGTTGFEPDRAWVMDIARRRDGELRLIEINSFSCSGLYACDKRKVVEAVSKAAWAAWENKNGVED